MLSDKCAASTSPSTSITQKQIQKEEANQRKTKKKQCTKSNSVLYLLHPVSPTPAVPYARKPLLASRRHKIMKSPTVQECELAKLHANRRPVGMLNRMREKKGTYRRGERLMHERMKDRAGGGTDTCDHGLSKRPKSKLIIKKKIPYSTPTTVLYTINTRQSQFESCRNPDKPKGDDKEEGKDR